MGRIEADRWKMVVRRSRVLEFGQGVDVGLTAVDEVGHGRAALHIPRINLNPYEII